MALFQTHSGLKHTDEDFCCTIAGISSISSAIPPCRDGMERASGSYEQGKTVTRR